MRSLTNFLLLETIFDNISTSNTKVRTFANRVLSPTLEIVSEDCGTKLGRVMILGANAVNKVSLLTYGTFGIETIEEGDVLTESKVIALLTNQSTVATRSISTCTASGGLCRKCVYGSYYGVYTSLEEVPAVSDTLTVNELSKRNFLTFLTDTHVGGLLGFKSIEIEGDAILPVREELIRSKIQEGELSQVYREVAKIPSMDQKFLEYARDMDDKLHKALFLILLYGVFINVKDL